MRRWETWSIGLVALALGCRGYEERPLEPEQLLIEADRTLRHPEARTGPSVTLAQCARWMLLHGPGVREAVARYRTELALASHATPLPNPTLDIGPQYGFGEDVTRRRLQPFGSIGLRIPLSDRLSSQDDLHAVRAKVARVEGSAAHRQLYVALRRAFVELVLAKRRSSTREQLMASTKKTVEFAGRLIEAGNATAIDVALFEIERGRAQAAFLEASLSEVDATARLASLVGVHPSRLEPLAVDSLAELAEEPPALAELRSMLVENHAELAVLRARYAESEAALRLEVAKQMPDLRIGVPGASDTGDRKATIGLTLGIELPLFDRNQQAIARAEERREELRVQYEAALRRVLIELERARDAAVLATRAYRLLSGTILPRARESLELARKSLAAGSGDALRLLEAERGYRRIAVEVLEAELAARAKWLDLERAVGRPLVPIAGDDEELEVSTPDGLAPLDTAESAGAREQLESTENAP